ncbi:hypothetical protein FRB90_009192 [Tulasnella sp. 427]|nr:hypothetical protein FRB90_009192 [Tulasnella sp. 427]
MELEFKGKNINECEQFIATVNKHARDNGKLCDDQWIADFVAVCLSGDALIWWSLLDEEVQGSWQLLRKEMISRFRPRFYGKSGSEAEDFLHQVRERALHVGRLNDTEWCADFASGCFAGRALRWYSSLESDVKKDWEKLQRAIFEQYDDGVVLQPQSASFIPTAPSAAAMPTRWRGRLGLRQQKNAPYCYASKEFSKVLHMTGRLLATTAIDSALELDYDSAHPSTLSIPGNQLYGHDSLGLHWLRGDMNDTTNFLALCGVDSKTGTGSAGAFFEGPLLINPWNISGLMSSWYEPVPVVATDASGKRLRAYVGDGVMPYVWFRRGHVDGQEVELFFERVG